MSHIVVGYDGSDCAKRALGKAADLAKDLGDGLVVVFGYEPRGYGGGEVPSHREAVKEFGEAAVGEAAELAAASGVEVETEMRANTAVNSLVEVAEERNARMIVVGTHGDSPLKGAILGSVTHELVHVSPIPVLLVRAT